MVGREKKKTSQRGAAAAPPRVHKSKPPSAKAPRGSPDADPLALLHELRVHQIELELQNEELRSARMENESALTRYTELFDFAPIGYATITGDHRILDINHAGAELLRIERERLRGRRFEQLVEVLQIEAFQTLLASTEVSGNRQSCEINLSGDGVQVAVRLSATVLRGVDPRILLAFEDIGELRRRQNKLEITEQALLEADRRKDEFLATLSHELRNPLAPIRNSVFVLGRSTPGSEAASRAQVIIDRQVTHLTRLIDDLLDVTRIARGKIQLKEEHLELGALLHRIVDDHRSSFEALGVRLATKIDPVPAWIRADSARITQIASNLLTNALKFTRREGRVEVQLRLRGEVAELRIIDTGVGIPREVLEHVFEPFAQAPQTLDRARGGLGLGLAMVKGLVALHGGSVNIHSEGLERGTEVCICLPLIAAPEQQSAETVPRSRRARRVLLIEDNLDACETLELALTLEGHQVKAAHDGPNGLRMAAEFQPEVVICDIGLPGMDGYAVARAVRQQAGLEDVLLVALSGYAQPEDLQRAREVGFDRHLAKPTSLEVLERLVSEWRPSAARSGADRTSAAG
jgi:two-component system CheB/CheR fusion protein